MQDEQPTQQWITTLTVDERTRYDSYTKEQVYEAYVLECRRTKQLTKTFNELQRRLAKIRYEVNNDN